MEGIMPDKANLPEWATDTGRMHGKLSVYGVDCDKAYPALLKELGVKDADVDDYWKEVAYQCIKMDMQVACGMNCELHFNGGKPKYRIEDQQSEGVKRASKGKEAREHYRRLRGFIPS